MIKVNGTNFNRKWDNYSEIILLSDRLVIKAFKYTFLQKGHTIKIDPYQVSKLLMCQMVIPGRQRIHANFGENHLLNYLVSQHVSEPAANQNIHLQCVSLVVQLNSPHTGHLLSIPLQANLAITRERNQCFLSPMSQHSRKNKKTLAQNTKDGVGRAV